MPSVDRPGWAGVTDELAEVLVRLRDEDAYLLEAGRVFVQFLRFGQGLVLDGPVVFVHTNPGPPGSPGEADLAALGWAEREGRPETLAQPEMPAPLEPATARQLAELIVHTLRDVYGVADPAEATYTSFNNAGLRPPRLRTIAAGEKQEPEVPDPATLLPEPSPTWQRWCALFADGLGDWSRAALDRLAAAQGWQASQFGWGLVTGAGEDVIVGEGFPAGHNGHGEITSLSVTQTDAEADLGTAFRQALAAAVQVLGHPPLVGGWEETSFARWRGARTTLTLSAGNSHLIDDYVTLMVEPTEPRENVIYFNAKTMMSPDDWSPDELWTTEPDVEAPQAHALRGMMFYRHSPSTTIDGTIDELRALFRSWCEALPMLQPYASSARWVLSRPDRTMIADGRFTPQLVTARFGRSDEFGERFSAAPGAGVADDLAERVRNALVLAGVTTPEELFGDAWSETAAERLDACRLTLQRR